jgi:hypothetical protein
MTVTLLPSGITWGLDCIGGNAGQVPGQPPVIWPYETGTDGVAWTAADRAKFTGSQQITVNQAYNSQSVLTADEFDVEAEAWDPGDIPSIVHARAASGLTTLLYGDPGAYSATNALLYADGLHDHVKWRLADWTGDIEAARGRLSGDVYAVQYGSPAATPHLTIPGTTYTLAATQCDINVIALGCLRWQQ